MDTDVIPLNVDCAGVSVTDTKVYLDLPQSERYCVESCPTSSPVDVKVRKLRYAVQRGACETCMIVWHCLHQCIPHHLQDYSELKARPFMHRGNFNKLAYGGNNAYAEEHFPGEISNKSLLIDIGREGDPSIDEEVMKVRASIEIFTPPHMKSGFLWEKSFESAPLLPPSSFSKESFDRALSWLHHCTTTHDRCKQPEDNGFQYPRRLIEVLSPEHGARNDAPVRLIETTGSEGPYTCLSHCWGDPEHLPLRTLEGGHEVKDKKGNFTGQYTERTLDQHMEGIPFKRLPATFRDAVLFLRISRVARYIWIDSLCIIQDSEKDWDGEAVKMADIYQNSLLTLAATKSEDSTGGLFSKSDPKYDTRTFRVASTDDETYTVCWRRARPHWFGSLDREEHQPAPRLLSRAWVYQERLLSPRTLHFGHQELLWECRQGSTCECGLWVRSQKQCLRFDIMEEINRNSSPPKEQYRKTSTVENRWRNAVMEYSRLNLTKSNDRLPAIAGIAKQVQHLRSGEQYLVGLWKGSLLEDLLWRVVTGFSSNRNIKRAPSWSWACLDNVPIDYACVVGLSASKSINEHSRAAKITRITLGDGDAFLRTERGSIELEGLLFPAKVTIDDGNTLIKIDADSKEYKDSYNHFHPDFAFWNSNGPDAGEAGIEGAIHCFLTHRDADRHICYFLVLRRKEEESTFERVGYLGLVWGHFGWDWDSGEFKLDLEPQTITIV